MDKYGLVLRVLAVLEQAVGDREQASPAAMNTLP